MTYIKNDERLTGTKYDNGVGAPYNDGDVSKAGYYVGLGLLNIADAIKYAARRYCENSVNQRRYGR